jgi:hypothetical protein
VLEIQALSHAAHFNVQVPLDFLESDFLAPVADGKVNLAKTTHTDTTLDREPVKRGASAGISEVDGSLFHETTCFILLLVYHITIRVIA